MQPQLPQLGNEGLVTIQIITPDNQRQLRVLLTQTPDEAFSGIDFTVLFGVAIAVAYFFHIERQHPV